MQKTIEKTYEQRVLEAYGVKINPKKFDNSLMSSPISNKTFFKMRKKNPAEYSNFKSGIFKKKK